MKLSSGYELNLWMQHDPRST